MFLPFNISMSSLSSSAIHLGGESVMGWAHKGNNKELYCYLHQQKAYLLILLANATTKNGTHIFTRGSKFNNSRHFVKIKDNHDKKTFEYDFILTAQRSEEYALTLLWP